MKHTPQPALCAACATRVHELAENTRGQHVLKRCDHDAAGIVIAVALVGNRQIRSWHIEGPMSEREADTLAMRLATTFAAAGGREMPVLQ
jgi:hypothetical protein